MRDLFSNESLQQPICLPHRVVREKDHKNRFQIHRDVRELEHRQAKYAHGQKSGLARYDIPGGDYCKTGRGHLELVGEKICLGNVCKPIHEQNQERVCPSHLVHILHHIEYLQDDNDQTDGNQIIEHIPDKSAHPEYSRVTAVHELQMLRAGHAFFYEDNREAGD